MLQEHVAGGATQRRKLEQHDEWGAVSLSLRLARYADVYTQGHKCAQSHSSSKIDDHRSTAETECLLVPAGTPSGT